MAESPAITTTQAQTRSENPNWIRTMDTFTQSSSFRQLMILLALAAVLSFMIGFFLWGRSPALVPMYSNLDSADANEVVNVLKEGNYQYDLTSDGAIRVQPGKVPEIRMLLAERGLPGGSGAGMEMLDEDMALGTSQFMEQARYQRAIETELARSIQTIRGVKAARVHLDEPEQSVFVRQERPTTASVVVDLGGGSLSDGQVKGIVHLVASSISGLSVENISVVDQSGTLLTNQGEDASGMGLTDRQFEYRQNLERSYARRIESLLAPIVGHNKVRAQVSADIDFSRREGTSETFGPGEGILLSEQLNEVNRALGSTGIAGGVPGALTNQPPGGGILEPGDGAAGLQAPENLTVEEFQELMQTTVDSNVSQTRNFNVDRQIEHVQFASGAISRLNVAVLLDDATMNGAVEDDAAAGLADDALERIEALVAQSVGLNMERGDQLTLSSFPFVVEEIEPVEVPIWEQGWFWSVLKNAGLGMAMLLVFLMVVRPLLKMLKENRQVERLPANQEQQQQADAAGASGGAEQQRQLSAQNQQAMADDYDDGDLSNVPQLVGNASYTDKLKQLRKTVDHDPKAVAAVVKQWTNAEG